MIKEPFLSALILVPMGLAAIAGLWCAVVFGEVPRMGLAMVIWTTIVVPVGLVCGFVDAWKHEQRRRRATFTVTGERATFDLTDVPFLRGTETKRHAPRRIVTLETPSPNPSVTPNADTVDRVTPASHRDDSVTRCAECGKEIDPHYCGDRCRKRAWRKRNG